MQFTSGISFTELEWRSINLTGRLVVSFDVLSDCSTILCKSVRIHEVLSPEILGALNPSRSSIKNVFHQSLWISSKHKNLSRDISRASRSCLAALGSNCLGTPSKFDYYNHVH